MQPVVLPYSISQLSLSSFSASNKNTLKTNIENILKEAFKSTFLYGASDEGDEIANNFSQTAAGPLADAIDSYVQNYIMSQSITITPKGTLIAPPMGGPVTGSLSTTTKDILIN